MLPTSGGPQTWNSTTSITPPAHTPSFIPGILYSFVPLILIGNLIIVIAFFLNRRLRTTAFYFVLSNSLCDILVGAVLIPTLAAQKEGFVGAMLMYTATVSLNVLCVSTIDRYVAIVLPFRYASFATKRNVASMLSASWIVPIVVSSLPQAWLSKPTDRLLMVHRVYLGVIAFSIITSVFCMTFAYVRIFTIGRTHLKAITLLEELSAKRNRRHSAALKRIARELKFAKMFASVSLTFFVFWLPTGYMSVVDDVLLRPELMPPDWMVKINFYWIFLSSIVNPMLYIIFHERFRKYIVNVVSCRGTRIRPAGESFTQERL